MNVRLTIKAYLCIFLLVHVGAVAVAIHAINASLAYWSNFAEGGGGFPVLFKWVLASASWLPLLSVGVVLAGLVAAFKASDLSALHCLACVVGITFGILCVTAFGLSQPIAAVAQINDQGRSEPSGAANGSQPFRSETTRTSGAAGSRR